jgi:hypothetical protein
VKLFHVPKDIDENILQFSKLLSNNISIFIDNIEFKDSIKADCFNNVQKKISQDGGDAVFGWIIWELSGVILQAEFHSVWKKDNILFDVTSYDVKANKIIFVEDNQNIYDGKRVNNKFYKILDGLEVDMYIDSRNLLFDLTIEHQKGIVNKNLSNHLDDIKNRQNRFLTFIKNKIGRNGLCFCKSGKKLKNCCNKKIYK